MSKVSDVYDKIDVSASVTSSIIIKDTKYYPGDSNGFLGTDHRIGHYPSSKNVSLFSPESSKQISLKLIEPQ